MTRLNIPLFVALAASLLTAVPANGSRDTLPHQRMIRKRGPGPVGDVPLAYDYGIHIRQVPGVSATSASASGSASATSVSAAATTTSAARTTSAAPAPTTSATSLVTTSTPSSTVASTTSGGLLDSLTNLLSTSSTSSVVTSTTPSTTAAPTTSSAVATSAAPETAAAPVTTASPTLNLATSTPSKTEGGTTIVIANTVLPEAEASQSAAAKKAVITRNTIISLVVIAACIGGAIAIWTVIRKWKLSPSERFDDRMQPIDWAPQGAGGVPEETMEEKRHRRAGSSGSHGSFTSGGVGQSENGHAKGMHNDSQLGHAYPPQGQDFPPPHDFTAGPQPAYGQYYGGQQYAGGAGYADLQRGASVSESTYSRGASVTRGLSYSRGPVPGYEAQPGAAGVPPLPNPYGGEYGYDDYAPQPGHQQPQAQAQAQAPYRGYN